MLFLGGAFMGGDAAGIPCAPTDYPNLNKLTISNGKFRRLYITKLTDGEMDKHFPEDWDYDTIFYARFDKNTVNAGNVDWDIRKVSHLLIKRREKGDFLWTTIHVKKINTEDDYVIYGTDYTNAAKTEYEYAVLPSFYGVDGEYDSTVIYSDFEEDYLVSSKGIIHTSLTDGYCDMTANAPSSSVTTLHSRYPYFLRNSRANYISGSYHGSFMEYSPVLRDYDTGEKSIHTYQNKILAFLSDGLPKILKLSDSRILLVTVDSQITNSADGHYKNRLISFDFQEAGNVHSLEELYRCGLTEITEEWW